jgi:maltose O-acetyltransferase
VRTDLLEFARPITIGDNTWLGGNVTVLPGVTIGSNSVVGAGAVVTKDVPDNVIVVGTPAKVLREITDADREYWERQADEYYLD